MKAIGIAALLVAASAMSAAAGPKTYAVGQVWEYKEREQDKGSLLKIQRIDADIRSARIGFVYHISVIGLNWTDKQMQPHLAHAPVSGTALDASVTRLSDKSAKFPSAAPGIREWKKARGGVWTVPVAQIIDAVDRAIKP